MGNGIISRVYAVVCKVLWLHVDEEGWNGTVCSLQFKGLLLS